MVFDLLHFGILQTVVLLAYITFRKKTDSNILNSLFPSKFHFIFANTSVFLLCILYNFDRQLFCNPVLWTLIILAIFCISFVLLPFLAKDSKLFKASILISGLGFFISIYLLLFARWEYLLFVGFNIPIILNSHFLIRYLKRKLQTNIFDALYFYTIVVLMPFFLLLQLTLIFRSKYLSKRSSYLMVITPTLTVIVLVVLSFRINYLTFKIKDNFDNHLESRQLISNPIDKYLTELILGAHWKYHTQLCLYDGWRPPFHDPVLVIANKIFYPYSEFYYGLNLPISHGLYNQLFPNNIRDVECKCAKNERLFDL